MSDVDFKQALADAGIPTTEDGLRKAWEKEVAAQGSKMSNTSAYSPFWRVITALVTKPVMWLISFVGDTVLPNFFVKTARDKWLDMLAWAVNVERKGATKAQGMLLFTRDVAGGVLELSFEDGSKIIVNTQPPLHEVWLAAKAGGYHYRHIQGQWRDTRDGSEFIEALSRHASAQAGKPLVQRPAA